MLRIRQNSFVLALVAVLAMLLIGCAALAHHHESAISHHCVLCLALAQGGAVAEGVSLPAPHPGLFQLLILAESHPFKFCYSKTIQARAPPAIPQSLV